MRPRWWWKREDPAKGCMPDKDASPSAGEGRQEEARGFLEAPAWKGAAEAR